MAHDVLPPQAGPWKRSGAPEYAGPPSASGPRFNPYAPPSERADRADHGTVPRSVTPGELRLASPGQRLFAKLIDCVLLALALAPGGAVQLSWDTEVGVLLWSLGLLAIGVFQWAIIATSGQTLGKRWTGLRVVTEKAGRVGFFRGVVLRVWVMWLGSVFSTLGLALLLDPWLVFGKQRKTLHDHLAGTLVIVAGTPGDPY
jgi:uncharacterized RDD family membrane protein YckC